MNKKNTVMIYSAVIAIVVFFIALFVLNEDEQVVEKEPEKIYVGYEQGEKLDNFSREDAVDSLVAILIEAGESPEVENEENLGNKEDKEGSEENIEDDANSDEGSEETKTKINPEEDSEENVSDEITDEEGSISASESIMNRLEKLDNPETDMEDVLTEKLIDMIYLSDEFKEEKFNRQFMASALLIYHEIIGVSNDNPTFEPVIKSYDDIVYLDNKLMKAHIPLDIFVGNGTGIAFEMQYLDGEWKLNPYSAMMSLNLMGILDENLQQ